MANWFWLFFVLGILFRGWSFYSAPAQRTIGYIGGDIFWLVTIGLLGLKVFGDVMK
jgi:hypothetical protein